MKFPPDLREQDQEPYARGWNDASKSAGFVDMIASKALNDCAAENARLLAIVQDACEVLRHYDLPEHAFHYERVLAGKVPLVAEQLTQGPQK